MVMPAQPPIPPIDLRHEPPPARAAHSAPVTIPRISSDELLAGGHEIHIEHHGALYRLRQTSLGKLILTK